MTQDIDWTLLALGAAIVILIVLPPRWDPAIRWKEFNMRWAERLRRDEDEPNG